MGNIVKYLAITIGFLLCLVLVAVFLFLGYLQYTSPNAEDFDHAKLNIELEEALRDPNIPMGTDSQFPDQYAYINSIAKLATKSESGIYIVVWTHLAEHKAFKLFNHSIDIEELAKSTDGYSKVEGRLYFRYRRP